MTKNWNVGDWVVFDLRIGQIQEIRDGGCATFSDGYINSSGMLFERFRPLTLDNKLISENFKHYYDKLREIDGEAGFNYPGISQYFAQLALDSIDAIKTDQSRAREMLDRARDFVIDANLYKPTIQGIPLFRSKRR